MAEKEHIKDEGVTDKNASLHHLAKGAPVVAVVPRHSRQWVIGVVAIVVVVYLILMVAGLWLFHSIENNRNGMMDGVGSMTTTQHMGRSGFGMRGDQTYNVSQSGSDGLTTTTTNTTYTQTQGVVTSINSDNIVVAGGGKTQTIKTNSSTTYASDVKAAVNDTVVIIGTKVGDTITATHIAVYN